MRYVPHTPQDQQSLLASVGRRSIEGLFSDIPEKVRFKKKLSLPPPLSELELLEELKKISDKDAAASPFLGGDCYRHFIPSAVKHILGRSEFYSAYTPYQAEASQGILQAIYEYQTMLCELTGMDAANASMYDGATALTEAAFLACRATAKREVVVSSAVHPEHRKVLRTYARGAGLKIKEVAFDEKSGQTIDPSPFLSEESACLILQQPNFFGCLEKMEGLADITRARKAFFIVSIDPISLGILAPPGAYGADIVVGEGQSLGNPPSFGGPGLGIFAARREHVRLLPGRIAGRTADVKGTRGFCLTLQTREQHIRRERATSNICSNEALAALAAAVYLSVLGKTGMRKVAELCLQKAHYLKKRGSERVVFSAPSFKEFVIKTEKKIGLDLVSFYPSLKGCRLMCVTELAKKEQLDSLASQISA